MVLASTAEATGLVALGGPESAERQGDVARDRTSRLKTIVLSLMITSFADMG
jgi:hypothetical protein